MPFRLARESMFCPTGLLLMHDERSSGNGKVLLRWVALSLTLLLLYVLSLGPAYRFLPGPWLPTVYGPLVQLERHCPPLDRFITLYMEKVWHCGIW